MALQKKWWLLILMLLAIANIALYLPTRLYFLNDDLLHIPLTAQGHLFQNNFVRPLHELLVRVDLWLWNKQAFGYHITALILHFIVALQLFYVCKSIMQNHFLMAASYAKQISFLAAALFLLYAQHAEAIAWILGRTPVLSAVFFMGSVQLFFKKQIKPINNFVGFVLFLAALFTYEQCILYPIFLFFIVYTQKNKALKQQQLKFALAISVAAIIYIAFRKLISINVVSTYEGKNFIAFNAKILVANFVQILSRLFLNPYLTVKYFLISVVLFAIIILYIIAKQKSAINNSTIIFFSLIILLLIAPIISLGITIRSYESGRYLYLPSIFLCIALAMFFVQFSKSKFMVAIFFIFCMYTAFAKWQSAQQYKKASLYAQQVHQNIQNHFSNSNTPLVLDTLHLTVHRLPVFRVGFKTGIHWLYPTIDTNKIAVKYYHDEFLDIEK